MSALIESTLAYLKTQLEVPSQELFMNEVYTRDIENLPVGTTLHPTSGRSHSAPLTITRKLASKTEFTRNHDGAKFHLSHSTGKVKDHQGYEHAYGQYPSFHTDAEKKDVDDRRSAQQEKDTAASAIHKHMEGMKNGYGHHVGTLSDSDHAEILQHLEKLREKK